MQIIESITNEKNIVLESQNKLQRICFDKLKVNPLPNNKNETWRAASKPKLETFLNYSSSNDFYHPIVPTDLTAKNILRIIIGEDKQVNIKEKNYEITVLEEEELVNLIKDQLIDCDTTQNWSNLLNHYMTSKNNIVGLNISGTNIPHIEIISNSKTNLFNSKTLIINIKNDTKVDISQINIGDENCALSFSSYLFLGKNSKINHGIVSYGQKKSHMIKALNVFQEKDSEYNLGSLQFNFNFARLEIHINQTEGQAKTNIKGMQITKDNEQISTYAKIEFNGPNGYLNQLNKSLAKDRSHSVFEGLIVVPQIAQKTDASQLSRNLLLSNHAKIDTKPQLEIVADDVKCMHGATISQLNENELFYMRSRGLTMEQASKLQLRSYYQEIISFLPIAKERWDLINLLLKNQ